MDDQLKKWVDVKRSVKEKALSDLANKEIKYIKKYQKVEVSWIHQTLEDKVPEKLQDKLNLAFKKAFEWVFEKGTGVIEKSYQKKEHEQNYQINAYAMQLKQDKKAIQTFSKEANKSRAKNLIFSSIEGIGLGALGIGIPDIPIFTGMILKSIYEIALSYGFSYETEEERLFILKLIEVSLSHGDELIQGNKVLNQWIEEWVTSDENKMKVQITDTAEVMSKELLYMKFLQGIPIVGVVGGIADTIYLRKITVYAQLKYKRRFLRKSQVRVGNH